MPTLILLRLQANWTARPNARTLHGLATSLFEGQAVPEDGGYGAPDKPWAVAPMAQGATDDEWLWRATWLPDGTPPTSALAADTIRVGRTSCFVLESSRRRFPHATLADGPRLSEVTLEFTSPTYFPGDEADLLVPDPRLIMDSWQRRWNATLQPDDDDLLIDDATWRETRRFLSLADFDLRTVERDAGYGRPGESGFTGTATLCLTRSAPGTAWAALGALSRFAEYCGTGAQTTHGFGATRIVEAS